MGCRKNKLMAQQIQETVHKVWKEGGELPGVGTVLMLHHHIQKNNFGMGSKCSEYYCYTHVHGHIPSIEHFEILK